LSELREASDGIAALYENTRVWQSHPRNHADGRNERLCGPERPWDLAKDTANNEALHQVCSTLVNTFAVLACYRAGVALAGARSRSLYRQRHEKLERRTLTFPLPALAGAFIR
jgi:methionyl-tRNA synthetase